MFTIFNVLGHLLYSSLYAALGAAFNSADEAQHCNLILTLACYSTVSRCGLYSTMPIPHPQSRCHCAAFRSGHDEHAHRGGRQGKSASRSC